MELSTIKKIDVLDVRLSDCAVFGNSWPEMHIKEARVHSDFKEDEIV